MESSLAEQTATLLNAEGRGTLTLTRSSAGRVKLEFRTHTLGKVDLELDPGHIEDLLFGISEVPVTITRVIPSRKPSSY